MPSIFKEEVFPLSSWWYILRKNISNIYRKSCHEFPVKAGNTWNFLEMHSRLITVGSLALPPCVATQIWRSSRISEEPNFVLFSNQTSDMRQNTAGQGIYSPFLMCDCCGGKNVFWIKLSSPAPLKNHFLVSRTNSFNYSKLNVSGKSLDWSLEFNFEN